MKECSCSFYDPISFGFHLYLMLFLLIFFFLSLSVDMVQNCHMTHALVWLCSNHFLRQIILLPSVLGEAN